MNTVSDIFCRINAHYLYSNIPYQIFLFTPKERLINGIKNLKQILTVKCSKPSTDNSEEINQHIERIIKSATSKLSDHIFFDLLHLISITFFFFYQSEVKIAGGSTEFVNQILEKFKTGAQSSSNVILDDI